METIELKERNITDNFWIIVREDIENPGPMCDGFKLGDSTHEGFKSDRLYQSDPYSHHYMYSTKQEAMDKCEQYARKRRGAGEQYRYYVMQTVAVVQYRGKDNELQEG